MNYDMSNLAYVTISLDNVRRDACIDNSLMRKLETPENNGRKIFATSVMPQKGETTIDQELWVAPSIFPTGNGGIEIATFTEYSSQDRHRHDRATEIYTVLKGQLIFYINDREIPVLHEGDEIVILPGTVHQVRKPSYRLEKKDDFELIVRVHSISCYGEDDKYVQLEPDGKWVPVESSLIHAAK
jgi:quercetin dioxygenase-like cupin family protein